MPPLAAGALRRLGRKSTRRTHGFRHSDGAVAQPRLIVPRSPVMTPRAYAGPLQGIRILDLTRVLAGPYSTMLLGDLGAEILKIEPPGIGDETRVIPPYRGGESHYFLAINRNKRSLVVDLKQEAGQRVLLDLVPHCDALVENFRPGVLARLGLAPDRLLAANPRLIVCSISGFGQTGPLRDRPSYDIVTQAMTGAMSVTGEPGRPPVELGLPMGDLAGGLFAALGILAALQERQHTGRGQIIDVGLYDCMVGLLGYLAELYLFRGLNMNGTENWDRPPSVIQLIRISQRTLLTTSNRLGQG